MKKSLSNPLPMALIVNFTGYAGHYGMLGTSLCLFERLLDKGYEVDVLDIDFIKTLPLGSAQIDTPLLPAELLEKVENAALIVVNGEGTLHGDRLSSNRLLTLIEWLLSVTQMPMYLVNFSCFPASKVSMVEEVVTERYRRVIHAIALRGGVVAREHLTSEIFNGFGIPHALGFDSLPLTVRKHFPDLWHTPGQAIVLSGGAAMRKEELRRMAVAVEFTARPEQDILYVSGGADEFVKFDRDSHFKQIQQVIPRARFVCCASMKAMLELFADGIEYLFTGRFHYAIAARVIGTPTLCWTSNTYKIEAIRERLGLRSVFSAQDFNYQAFPSAVEDAIRSRDDIDLPALWASAELNYVDIPNATNARSCGLSMAKIYGILLERAGLIPSSVL